MVISDKSTEDSRNGRRSKANSPNRTTNGHSIMTSIHGDEFAKIGEGCMRVGRDYQATIPVVIAEQERRPEQCVERALLVWSPTMSITDEQLDGYITLSKDKYGYNAEQALGMLFWHKHDLDRAKVDLANFTPYPDEWTTDDKVLFEQAYQFHGKHFNRIRQMLPDKTVGNLVRFYYSWKKSRTRTSVMDRQARKLASRREDETSEKVSEEGSNSDSELEIRHEGKRTINRGIRRDIGVSSYVSDEKDIDSTHPHCSNCGITCTRVFNTTDEAAEPLCTTCFHFWKDKGMHRPTLGPWRKDQKEGRHYISVKNRSKPPKGMYINHDDLVILANGNTQQGEAMTKALDRELVTLKKQVQNNKQMVSSLKRITSEGIGDFKLVSNCNRINARWTNDEHLLAVQGFTKYGKGFEAIAELIATKTEAHVRSFYLNYNSRYKLDAIIKDCEMQNGGHSTEDKLEVECITPNESTNNNSTTKQVVSPAKLPIVAESK